MTLQKLHRIEGESLDKRYGAEEGVTYQNSPYRVMRHDGTHRIFLSAKALKRYMKNRRDR